jgi:L-asparaginase II
MRGEPFVIVRRGGRIESIHHVAACAVDADGDVQLALGDIEAPFYLRSAAKPFIAATALATGVAERFGLETHEIAVMTASHNGQPQHIEAVRSILQKIGLDETALRCGPHEPYDEDAKKALRHSGIEPRPIHNNCSGKHAGILALCRTLGADTASYLSAENPAQTMILATCAAISGDPEATFRIGVDGCGIPAYATSLRHAATSYMRLATLSGVEEPLATALRTVREAMIAYPEYMSGTGEFDAALMRAGDGAIACKGGAEGVHGSAVIDAGIGMVLKVIDGAERARPPASIALLSRLGALDPSQVTELTSFSQPALHNRAGTLVGEITTVDAA